MAHNQYYEQLRAAVGRPAVPATPKGGDAVTFQIMDVVVSDHLAAGVCRRDLAGKAADPPLAATPPTTTATATMFGVTADGRSVCCHVSGFRPSCHVRFTTREGMQAVERWLRTGRRAEVDYRWSLEQHFNFAGFTWDAATGTRVRNNYLRIDSPTVEGYVALRWVASNLPRHELELVEHDGVPLYTKFYDRTQLTPFQWVTVTAADIVDDVVSSCDIEMRCGLGDWVAEPALTAPAPYLFASCDIEAHSATGEFPNRVNSGDVAFMVGVTLQRFGGGLQPSQPQGGADMLHVSFVYDDTGARPAHSVLQGADGPIHVLCYPTERAMLEGWRDCLCVWLDVDVVMWWNGFRFDLPYMAYRVLGRTPCPVSCRLDAAFPAVGSRFFQFSKFVRECTPVKMRTITSAAMGDNEICVWAEEYGRLTMDLYDIVCKREKMSCYSLDSVCRKVLGVGGGTVTWRRGGTAVTGTGTRFTKLTAGDSVRLGEEFYTIGRVASDTALELAAVPIDIDADVVDQAMAGQITKLDLPYTEQHALYKRRELDAIVDYCCRDCVAPLRLLWKLRYFLNDFQMCRITFTPLQQLLSRGQGIKGLNQVIRFAHAKGFLLNQFTDMEQVDYQGATVVEPTKGFHTRPVVTLDFASLYPSIIISRWMCWTTVVTDQRYAHVPGIQYHDVPVSDSLSFRFACNVDAVCPELLKALLAARKATKREMFAADDAGLKALLNAKQLAEKVCCNSVYGLTGAKTGLLRCVAIASSTTAYGRHMLELTKRLAVQHLPNVSIIYGDTDSIMMKFHDLPGTRAGIEEAWRLGEEAADWITDQLANGVVLECEKVYCPYLLVMKKCYAAYKYEGEGGVLPAQPVRDVKGLELAKRDTSKFIRQAQSRVINSLLDTGDSAATLRLVTKMIEDVCMLRVPLAEFVTSKSLRREYKAERVVQQEVNRRRQARAPGSEYKPGERVPMVAVERRGPGTPLLTERDSACELMDDPEFVAAQGWRPNRRYYLKELHRKVERVLPDDKERLDGMFRVGFNYLESLKFRAIRPFRLGDKLARCVPATPAE